MVYTGFVRQTICYKFCIVNYFVGTVKGAAEGLYFLGVCICLPSSYYFLCALYFRSLLRGLTLPVVNYLSIRVGSSDFFVGIISFDC